MERGKGGKGELGLVGAREEFGGVMEKGGLELGGIRENCMELRGARKSSS